MYLRFEVQLLLWNWYFLPFLVLLFLFCNKQIISFSWSIHFSITVFIAMHVKLSLYSKNKSLQLLKAIKWDSLETKYGLFFFFSFQTPETPGLSESLMAQLVFSFSSILFNSNSKIKGMLRRNTEHFLKKRIYEKLGFSQIR